MRSYPAYVFDIREDVTQRNMRDYDRLQARIEKLAQEINPDYYRLDWFSQIMLREVAKKKINPDYEISYIAKNLYLRRLRENSENA